MLENKLAELCSSNGVTYEDVAKACNVRTETITRIARGEYNPTVTLALKIATYFDTLVEDVYSLDYQTLADVFFASKITSNKLH